MRVKKAYGTATSPQRIMVAILGITCCIRDTKLGSVVAGVVYPLIGVWMTQMRKKEGGTFVVGGGRIVTVCKCKTGKNESGGGAGGY